MCPMPSILPRSVKLHGYPPPSIVRGTAGESAVGVSSNPHTLIWGTDYEVSHVLLSVCIDTLPISSSCPIMTGD